VNPVPERLPIHPADPGGLVPAHPFGNGGKGQEPTGLPIAATPAGQISKLGWRKVFA